MAGTRRKDNKGRVLRKGEGQRKDNTYDYRYIDVFGKRRSVYAATLKELREKEAEVEKANNARLDYASGNCTVLELVERYTKLKLGVRYNTKAGYAFVTNILKNDDFGRRKIRDIRVSDVQLWLAQLQKNGKGYSTIASVRGVLKPAFQMACDEDVLLKNPFQFNLGDVIVNDSKHREAMTQEVYKSLTRIAARRPHFDEESVVDGYGGFLLIDKKQQPKVVLHIARLSAHILHEYG